ncbi:MAG: primosomal protein N' [Candidatus Hatepunaea meridiana]|nr:primosomal protein N' [Candidatus Hatepunaea meridiana]
MQTPQHINLAEINFADTPFGGYNYRVPSNTSAYKVGIRVIVSFGSRRRIGIITRIYKGDDDPRLKDILEPIDQSPLIPDDVIKLTRWIADYYVCEWGEALNAAIPSGLKPTGQEKYKLSELGLSEPLIAEESGPAADLWRALRKVPLSVGQIRRRFPNGSGLLDKFRRRGWVELTELEPRRSIHTMTVKYSWTGEVSYDEARETLPEKAHKLRKAVDLLDAANGQITQKELSRIQTGFGAIMRNLLKKGWVIQNTVPVGVLSSAQEGLEETADGVAELTPRQAEIVVKVRAALKTGKFESFLLHGITGSGKTLVYLEIIAEALALGKGSIVMVPEISLTPQLTGRVRRRFGDNVIVTHSRLSPTERRDVWANVRSGKARIVIGPRSVLFAPMRELGLIVIDEEHDDSYCQSEPAPRYNGRNAALYRARLCGAVALLGSATPDVCSYNNALDKRYRLVELPERYGKGDVPDIWVVKWSSEAKAGILSPQLKSRLQQRLESKEQTILLVNRRGFSTIIKCPDCGDVANCPNCDITLRYHRVGQKLACHYCGYEQTVIDVCPKCQGKRLVYSGLGTQRAQRELEATFPDARIERMDLDTTRRLGAHQEILSRFARREFDVLLGTQMVAKGHDFPGVTLVGILLADLEWLKPDFRSVEKAFRMLTQASGRTGRAGKGEVVIQAWDPTHPMLRWVQGHNYHKMFEAEVVSRKELGYPPFGDLIRILVRCPDQKTVIEAAKSLKEALTNQLTGCVILGPAPPPVEKVEKHYRRGILLKLPKRNIAVTRRVKKVLREVLPEFRNRYKRAEVRFIVNVDPVEI